MNVTQREIERLQRMAKSNKSKSRSIQAKSTQKLHSAPPSEEHLHQLSIPSKGPIVDRQYESFIRSQQISEVIKAEHDLINTIHQSASEISSKLMNLLSRHLRREQRQKTEFEKIKSDLWGKVVDNYLIFQNEEKFPKEYHLVERVALKKLINHYYEFWLLRATHAYTTQAMVLFNNNLESHHEEIMGLPDDEHERGILGLIDIYISPSTVAKCESILTEYPFPTSADGSSSSSPPSSVDEEDDDGGVDDGDDDDDTTKPKAHQVPLSAAERKRARLLREELAKDRAVGESMQMLLDDEAKANELRDSVKQAAVVKGWENSRDILDVQFTKAIEEYVPEEGDDESSEEKEEEKSAGGDKAVHT